MRGTFWTLLRFLSPFRRMVAMSVLLGLATFVAGLGLLGSSAHILAAAALHPSVADLALPIVGVRFFGISRGVFRYLERYVSHQVTFSLLGRMRVWFYAGLDPLAPARLMQYRSGDLLSRVTADIETLQNFYVRGVAPVVVAVLAVSLTGYLLSWYGPALAIALVFFLLLSGFGLPWLAWRWTSGLGERIAGIRAEMSVSLVDSVQGLADLVVFGQTKRHLQRIRDLNGAWLNIQEAMGQITAIHSAANTLLMNLAMWVVLIFAIPLVSSGRLNGGNLPVLAVLALASFEAVLPLSPAFQHLRSSLAAASRLFDIIEAKPLILDPVTASPVPAGSGLVVEDLRFRYSPGEPYVLEGLDFTLDPGRRIAVVGPNGAGKSTLVNLLLRFWPYEEGRILFGGQDLKSYRQEDLRRYIAVVSQHTHLFNTTIRENIMIARPTASEAELVRACDEAQMIDFIHALPLGFDTMVGEQGLRLSGGERQRLSIARALLRNAPLLILDEATSSLDSVTEQEVMKAVRSVAGGRTTLIITHRLTGLEDVDEILVLRAGRVVERGRHYELVQLNGIYRHMWEIQTRVLLREVWNGDHPLSS